ncbi:MAG TPA: hypothetical protein VJ778_12010 [Burkholderiales bacterium]|nr:hypothetical protein [Burkholderiales bacterium]
MNVLIPAFCLALLTASPLAQAQDKKERAQDVHECLPERLI